MTLKMLTISLLAMLVAAPAWADSPVRPMPMVTAAGPYYFTMLPATIPFQTEDSDAYGVAFQLMPDGSSKELWRVEGWYALETYLSNDGHYLVRMGNWPTGDKPSQNDLAVAFYKDGIELKRFSTADLIKNPASVSKSISHYQWRGYEGDPPKLSHSLRFSLETVEGRVFVFDARSGKILEEKAATLHP